MYAHNAIILVFFKKLKKTHKKLAENSPTSNPCGSKVQGTFFFNLALGT